MDFFCLEVHFVIYFGSWRFKQNIFSIWKIYISLSHTVSNIFSIYFKYILARLVLFLVKPKKHSLLMKQPWNNHDTVNRYGVSVRRCFSAGMRVSVCSFFLFGFSVMDSFIMFDRRVFYLALFSATFFHLTKTFQFYCLLCFSSIIQQDEFSLIYKNTWHQPDFAEGLNGSVPGSALFAKRKAVVAVLTPLVSSALALICSVQCQVSNIWLVQKHCKKSIVLIQEIRLRYLSSNILDIYWKSRQKYWGRSSLFAVQYLKSMVSQ